MMLRKATALILPLGLTFSPNSFGLSCGTLVRSGTEVAVAGSTAVAAATTLSRLYTIKQIVKLSRDSVYPSVDADPAALSRNVKPGDQMTIVSRVTPEEASAAAARASAADAVIGDAGRVIRWDVSQIGENLTERSGRFDVWTAGSSLNADGVRGPVDPLATYETKVLTVQSENQVRKILIDLRASGRTVTEINLMPAATVRTLAISRGIAITAGAAAAVLALVTIQEHFTGKLSQELQRRFITGVCR